MTRLSRFHDSQRTERKVPGRESMSYTEEDWVDEGATSHRGQDE